MSDIRIKTFEELVGKTIKSVTDTPPDEFMLFYKVINFTDGSHIEVHSSICRSEGRLLEDAKR